MSQYKIHMFNKTPYFYFIEEQLDDIGPVYNSVLYIQDHTSIYSRWYKGCSGILEQAQAWHDMLIDPNSNLAYYLPVTEVRTPIWCRNGEVLTRVMFLAYGSYENIDIVINDRLV